MSHVSQYEIIHCPTTVFVETEGTFAGSLHVIMYPTSAEQEHRANTAIIGFAAAHGTIAKVTDSTVFARADDQSVTITMFRRLTTHEEEPNGDQKTAT